MTTLLAYLQSVHPLPAGLSEHLQRIVQRKILLPRAYLLREGEVCREVFFIQKGLLRCFTLRGTTEVCSWFMKEGDVIISVESWFRQLESRENIQALERSELYFISHDQLQAIYEHYPEFNLTGRVLTEKYYLQSEQRLLGMRLRRSAERYGWLMETDPELLLRVPAKYLASYLGMSEVMLSNIRSRR